MSTTTTRPKRRLTKIKLKILATVLRHRLLTADQIQQRCLPCEEGNSLKGRQEYTRKLLRELYQDKYLLRRKLIQPALGNNPYVYASTWSAAQAVAEANETTPEQVGWDAHDKVITWTNENLFHLLRENDVQFVFEIAAYKADVELREWQSDRMLAKDKESRRVKYVGVHGGVYYKTLIPDGSYLFATSIEAQGRSGTAMTRIFVEIDMGTQTISQKNKALKNPQRTWESKTLSYLSYFQPGGLYEQHYGSRNARVVVLTTSQLRLNRMKEATEKVGGTDRFWFATFEQFTQETALAEPIFLVATQGDAKYPLIDVHQGGKIV